MLYIRGLTCSTSRDGDGPAAMTVALALAVAPNVGDAPLQEIPLHKNSTMGRALMISKTNDSIPTSTSSYASQVQLHYV